jgi:hypothetical protein
VDFNKVIDALKDLSPWRFFLLWIGLIVVALTPLGWLIGLLWAWRLK